jgi:AcrR family transcriptional regulator
MAKPKPQARAPIWTRPAPGTRHPRLTREQIARAALAIADAEGFAAVSMRRVAIELDVGTMTLYYYVKTKDDLIALMDDALAAEVVIRDDQLPRGWRAALTAIARTARDVFARHPWALYSLQGTRLGPNSMRHIEQSIAAVGDAPLDVQGKLWLLSIVDDYVFGHVLRRISETASHMDHKVMKTVAEFFEAQLETGAFPHLEALIGDEDVLPAFARFARWMTEDARFEIGLAALLDGVERQLRTEPEAPGREPHGSPPERTPIDRRDAARATRAEVRDRRSRASVARRRTRTVVVPRRPRRPRPRP